MSRAFCLREKEGTGKLGAEFNTIQKWSNAVYIRSHAALKNVSVEARVMVDVC